MTDKIAVAFIIAILFALTIIACGASRHAEAVSQGIVLVEVRPGLCFAVATIGSSDKGGVAIEQVDCCHLRAACPAERVDGR